MISLDEPTILLLELLDAYGVRLHALFAKLALRDDVADELLQELFLKLYQTTGFMQASRPEMYLFRSAINLAFDWRRRTQRTAGFVPLLGNEVGQAPAPVDEASRREELDRVLTAVSALSPSDRELVTLRFLHGSSYEELAELSGSTPHRIRARCAKAISRLRTQLEPSPSKELADERRPG